MTPGPGGGDPGPGSGAPLARGRCGRSLPASKTNVELVGGLRLTRMCGGIADVAVGGRYAYLHAWKPYCQREGRGGTFVVDVSDPRKPRKVNFIASHEGSYPGEGGSGEGSVRPIRTRHFSGWMMVRNNERCSPAGVGGFDLIDVTDPLHPRRLTMGYGDFDVLGEGRANDTHQVFLWQQGDRAFVITTDNVETDNVDIYDVTDPRHPRQISETGIGDWPTKARRDLGYGGKTVHHQPIVARIDGVWTALLSYWDVGWVKLDLTDPSAPRFVADSAYPDPDPVTGLTPEGNAHSADWNRTREFIVGADEDFSRYRTEPVTLTTGHHAGEAFASSEFEWTKPVGSLPGEAVNGPTVYGGYACSRLHRDRIPKPSTAGPVQEAQERILVVSRGPADDPNHPHEPCLFSEKVEAAQDAGWDAVVVANHHGGAALEGDANAFLCGGQGHEFGAATIPGICIGHRALHVIFDSEPSYGVPYPESASERYTEPRVGQPGANISARRRFDGWGYVHLLDADTLAQIGLLAPSFVRQEDVTAGGSWMTVHDPTTDPDRDLVYMAWYGGGLRVARFGEWGIEETGHYVTPGADYWGVAVGSDRSRSGHGLPGGGRVVLVADRDYGLRIFRYVGPGAANVTAPDDAGTSG